MYILNLVKNTLYCHVIKRMRNSDSLWDGFYFIFYFRFWLTHLLAWRDSDKKGVEILNESITHTTATHKKTDLIIKKRNVQQLGKD